MGQSSAPKYPEPPTESADFPDVFAAERERIKAWRKNRAPSLRRTGPATSI